jgi:hypothetical protein
MSQMMAKFITTAVITSNPRATINLWKCLHELHISAARGQN